MSVTQANFKRNTPGMCTKNNVVRNDNVICNVVQNVVCNVVRNDNVICNVVQNVVCNVVQNVAHNVLYTGFTQLREKSGRKIISQRQGKVSEFRIST